MSKCSEEARKGNSMTFILSSRESIRPWSRRRTACSYWSTAQGTEWLRIASRFMSWIQVRTLPLTSSTSLECLLISSIISCTFLRFTIFASQACATSQNYWQSGARTIPRREKLTAMTAKVTRLYRTRCHTSILALQDQAQQLRGMEASQNPASSLPKRRRSGTMAWLNSPELGLRSSNKYRTRGSHTGWNWTLTHQSKLSSHWWKSKTSYSRFPAKIRSQMIYLVF